MKRVTRDKIVADIKETVTNKPELNLTKAKIDYDIHVKEFYRLKSRAYFDKMEFDPHEVINSAFVLLADSGVKYDRYTFFETMRKVMNKENYDRIKAYPYLWKLYLKRNRDWKSQSRRNVGDYYVRHLLSKKYSMEFINDHPELEVEKRKQILNLRGNNGSPIDNPIPPTPVELIDLSLIDLDYKGYAISAQGELFSCKASGRSDMQFIDLWIPISKRKSGCVRLNIRGIKKDLSVNKLLVQLDRMGLESI